MRGVAGDDDFHRFIDIHGHLQARGDADVGPADTVAAGSLLGEIGLEYLLVFGRQWRLLRDA